MNTKGQTFMIGIMYAFIYFIAIVVLIEAIKQGVNIARDNSHLDCANTSISTGQQMSCIVVDSYLPSFIGVGLAVAISFLGIKRYAESVQ
jgi:hypothetical protein